MSQPDVALIAPYPARRERHGGRSGVASYTANLSEALAAQGAKVHVVAPREPGSTDQHSRGPITVERPYRRGPLALTRACAAALRSGAPVVHVQHEHFLFGGPTSVPGLLPALDRLRRAGRGPVVTMHQIVDPRVIDRSYTHLHRVGVPAPMARFGLSTLQRSVSRRARACIVHEQSFSASVPGAVVIGHGVEDRCVLSRRHARRLVDIDDEAFVALCFGFVAPYKGLQLALAAGQLAAPHVQIVIAGGEHPRLAGRESYLDELRRGYPHARFTGYVPDSDVGAWFTAADLALMTHPKPHGSSGALALAIANATPVLLSKGMARTVGASPSLVAPDEPAELATRLVALATSAAEREALRDACQSLGAERSWSDVAFAHLALYEEVKACPWP